MAKIEGKVARRYARALFELTQPARFDARRDALDGLSKVWLENSSLRNTLNNPGIPLAQREAALRDIGAKLIPGDSEFANFLSILLSGGRLPCLPQVAKLYSALVDSAKKLLALEIYSAFDLPASEKEALEAKIRAQLNQGQLSQIQCGNSATFSWKVDPDLLGGLLVKAGDCELDSSVRSTLEKIRQQVLGA